MWTEWLTAIGICGFPVIIRFAYLAFKKEIIIVYGNKRFEVPIQLFINEEVAKIDTEYHQVSVSHHLDKTFSITQTPLADIDPMDMISPETNTRHYSMEEIVSFCRDHVIYNILMENR